MIHIPTHGDLDRRKLRQAEAREQAAFEARKPLWRACLSAALQDRHRIERAMALGQGVDWPELAPLYPVERTEMFRQLRRIFQLPPKE